MDIGKSTPNLVNLALDPRKGLQQTFDENVIHLSTLRKLKCLRIECPKFSGRALIDSLAENNVPIEDLTVLNNRFDHNNRVLRDLSHCVPKLKVLKKLRISFIFDEMLIDIAQKLPHLQEIYVTNNSDVTPRAIKDTLKHGQNLSKLSIHFDEILLDLDDYNGILALAKHRVNVELFYKDGSVDVPNDILMANNLWLKIDKYQTDIL